MVAVHQACQTGYAWDYSAASAHPREVDERNVQSVQRRSAAGRCANQLPGHCRTRSRSCRPRIATSPRYFAATRRLGTTGATYGIPITYSLSITTGGLLSLSYSYGGGNYQPIISGPEHHKQRRAALDGALRLRRLDRRIAQHSRDHVFPGVAAKQLRELRRLNQKQTAKVQTGTQVYFAFYNPNNWTGSVTSQYLDSANGMSLQIDPLVNWDASCVLTGVPASQTCASTGAPGPSRPRIRMPAASMLTYNPTNPAFRSPGRMRAPRSCRRASKRIGRHMIRNRTPTPYGPSLRTCASNICAASVPMSRTPSVPTPRPPRRSSRPGSRRRRPPAFACARACSATPSTRARPGWAHPSRRFPTPGAIICIRRLPCPRTAARATRLSKRTTPRA